MGGGLIGSTEFSNAQSCTTRSVTSCVIKAGYEEKKIFNIVALGY